MTARANGADDLLDLMAHSACRSGTAADPLGALMQRAQGGDREAYATLLRGAAQIVRAIASHQRAAIGDVEDVVQEVLVTIHGIRHTYDPARPFRPWLAAITRRRIADACRRRRRIAGREVAFDDDISSKVPAPDRSECSIERRALARAVAALPPAQRAAVEMLKLRELSLEEASAISGTSVAALKVAAHRAVAALRRALIGRPSGDPA